MKKYLFSLTVVRKIIFFLMIFISFLLQFSIIPRTELPFPVYFLITVTSVISMHENDISGLFWGALAGILWDTASPVTDGAFALIFAVIFLITGLLTRYVMRNTLLTSMLFSAWWSLIPAILQTIYFHKALTVEILSSMLTDSIIPSVIISIVLCLPVYPLVASLSNHFRKERQ